MRIGLLGSFTLYPVQEWLRAAGHDVERLATGVDLACASCRQNLDLLLVDLEPNAIAAAALSHLRMQVGPSFPIVAILPHDREEHVVAGLRNGADDCIAAPLRREEFLARVTIPSRWRSGATLEARVEMECFSIDVSGRKLWRHGSPVALTEKDFDLAVLLLSNVGRMFSRGHIASAVWGGRAMPTSRTIDTHVSRVRSKLHLREHEGWRLEAIYSKGYRLLLLDSGVRNADAGSGAIARLSTQRISPSGQEPTAAHAPGPAVL